MRISLITFDDFTDIDLFLMWDLLNRVEDSRWSVQIHSNHCCSVSSTGIKIQRHDILEGANTADAVVFAGGRGARRVIHDEPFLSAFNLDPERQLIGSICSGALILAALGLLEGKRATTYPTARLELGEMGVQVIEEPFVCEGNVATAAGCLAAQYLVGWVLEELLGKETREKVLKQIQPVGAGLLFNDFPTSSAPPALDAVRRAYPS